MDYRGGTYISQLEAEAADQVLPLWAQKLDPRSIADFEERHKQELIAEVKQDQLAPLDGLVNAWCKSALISNSLALINVIATMPAR